MKTTDKRLEQAKKMLKAAKASGVGTMTLICSECGKEKIIHTNHKEIYTNEVRKNWKCGVCMG